MENVLINFEKQFAAKLRSVRLSITCLPQAGNLFALFHTFLEGQKGFSLLFGLLNQSKCNYLGLRSSSIGWCPHL